MEHVAITTDLFSKLPPDATHTGNEGKTVRSDADADRPRERRSLQRVVNTANRLFRRCVAFWNAFTQPRYSTMYIPPEHQHIARLMITLLFSAFLAQAAFFPFSVLDLLNRPHDPSDVIRLFTIPATYISYEACRRGYFVIGIGLINMAGLVAILSLNLFGTGVESSQTPYTLNLLLAILIFDAIFLPPLFTLIILVCQLLIIALFPFINPAYDWNSTFSQTFLIHLVLGIISLTLLRYYRANEVRVREQLRAAEQSLARSEARTRHVLENVPAFVFALDENGLITFFGGREQATYPIPVHMAGQSIFDVPGVRERPESIDEIKRVLAGETFTSLFEVGDRFYQMNFTPLFEPASPSSTSTRLSPSAHAPAVQPNAGDNAAPAARKVTGAIVLALNIADQMHAQAQQTHLMLERERLQMVSHFLGGFAHDVRTPLSVISTSTYLIQKSLAEAENQRIARHIKAIGTQVSHFVEQLQNVQNMVRISAETGDFAMRPHEADDLLASVFYEFEEAAAGKEHRLSLHIDPMADLRMYGDADEIRRALRQLVTNAIRFTDDGGDIRLHARRDGNNILIEVRDNGVGIPADALDRIFMPLYRADKARSQQVGGMGLGLSLAKTIIEAHHGTITVQSAVGQGSTFTVRLPTLDSLRAAGERNAFSHALRSTQTMPRVVATGTQSASVVQAEEKTAVNL